METSNVDSPEAPTCTVSGGSMDRHSLIPQATISGDGYEVAVPPGWQSARFPDEILLVNESAKARIIIRAHPYMRLPELEAESRRLPDQADTRLTFTGTSKRIEENAIAVDLSGTWSGRPAWVRLIATLSPYGGGVFILAIAETMAHFGRAAETADAVAGGMKYRKSDPSQLMEYLSDMYEDDRGTQVMLLRGGVFARKSQGAWSVSLETPYQETVPAWGMVAGHNPFGNWTVIGDRREGTIIVTCDDRSREFILYRVIEESGGKPTTIVLNGGKFHPIPEYRRQAITDWMELLPRRSRTSPIRR